MLIFGVEDRTGTCVGLDYAALQEINNRIATIANELVKPSLYLTTEAVLINATALNRNDVEKTSPSSEGKKLLIVHVEEGVNKPYKDRNGTIWMKQGSDKRKIVDNHEILRLFAQGGMLEPDEMQIPDTGFADIDIEKVELYKQQLPQSLSDLPALSPEQFCQNVNITRNGRLTLGGLLFFAKNPQHYKSACCIEAVTFLGNSIGGMTYHNSRHINGTIPRLFRDGMDFFIANLNHEQRGQNFNSTGILEISEIALEELLQNALVHRDYTINAPIRLMIFDNRVEMISPGCLPNNLRVENIKLGQAVVRNNLLRTYCSKMMLYRGFGSGIPRALEQQPNVELVNDVQGEQFIVRIPRRL
jgi:predicted HTH transcriptional regulator